MKIAFLNIYQNKVNRGAETFVSELSKRLLRNHQVDLISDYSVDWSKKDSTYNWRRRAFIDYWSLLIARFTVSKIPKIWKEKYDVIVPLNGGWQVAVVRIITWLYGGKMIVSGQSGIGWDDRNNLWSFPNAFVALNTKSLTWAKRANPFVKSFYIPNGVDIYKFNPEGTKFASRLKPPVILSVGAFTKQKRLDLVIKAVSKMKASLLVVGGGGNLLENIKALGEKSLGTRFKILSVPFEKMPEIYRSANVFTLPSVSSESFGNVLVEAMATNLPVVATNDVIRREIVGDAGILVDPVDTEEYAKALRKALEIKWGDKPRKQAENFSWDLIAQKYENLFKNINF